MSFDWKALIRSVAPTLATALGGPLAGAATAAISTAILGKPDGTEEEISAAAAGATPELLAKIKQAENDFTLAMKQLDVDVVKISTENTDSARTRDEEFIKQKMRNTRADILAYLAVVVLVAASASAILIAVYANMNDVKVQAVFALLNLIIGNQFKTVNDVYNFEFGSSQGSVQAQKTLRKIAEGS